MGQSTYKPLHHKHKAKEFNPIRDRSQELYGSYHWKNYRARFIRINNECYACGSPASEVDHLRPHRGDMGLFKQLDNHIPLCAPCHSTVTAKFDRYWKPNGSLEPKIKWLHERRMPTEKWTPKKIKVLGSYD